MPMATTRPTSTQTPTNPLRPMTEPWDISTSYPYPRNLSKTVTEGTWLRIATHPILPEIVFDMLGDLYCMLISLDEDAKGGDPSPQIEHSILSATGQLVFISDAGFGVDNIWTMPYAACAEMSGQTPEGARDSTMQQTNSTFRFSSSPAFHPTEPRIIATKWFLTGRPNGAGEAWEFPYSENKTALLPERGRKRVMQRSLPPTWSPDRYFESQLGSEQAQYTPSGDGIIFSRNVRDGMSGKFSSTFYGTEINSQADARDALMRVYAEGGEGVSLSVKNYQLPARYARQRLILSAAELNMLVIPESGWSFDWGLTYFIDGYTSHEHPLPIPTLYDDVLSRIAASGSSYTPLAVMNYAASSGNIICYQMENIPGDTNLRKYVNHDVLESLTEVKQAPKSSYLFFNTTRSTASHAARGVRTNIGAHGEQPIGYLYHSEMEIMGMGGQKPYDVLRAVTLGNADVARSAVVHWECGGREVGGFGYYPEGCNTIEKVREEIMHMEGQQLHLKMSQMAKDNTFQAPGSAQTQQTPGLESKMQPASEATKLETPDGIQEYKGSGKLKGKKALITGGDSGIGRSVAALFAREGADVTIVYLPIEEDDAQGTKGLVEAEGRECLLFPGDLRKRDICKGAVEAHVKQFGKINILINNASKQYMCTDFTEIDLDQVQDVFETNIIQMFAVTKFALPHMSKGDSIINNTSVTAFRGTKSMVDYASTKGAIVAFTRSLAQQLVSKGIRVNAVAPGSTYTPIQVDTRDAESMQGWASGKPLGRPGQPSEVATSFVFLASGEAALYYGQILHPYPIGE
ncbi:uncharacterized protein BDV17DRAFT_288987 [Aspergillus undulatus]|uniref:uncharacterized protein n=1 Tax=Aspergillus undulatus TaxID=1810928 RepID=UPI003CCCB707